MSTGAGAGGGSVVLLSLTLGFVALPASREGAISGIASRTPPFAGACQVLSEIGP